MFLATGIHILTIVSASCPVVSGFRCGAASVAAMLRIVASAVISVAWFSTRSVCRLLVTAAVMNRTIAMHIAHMANSTVFSISLSPQKLSILRPLAVCMNPARLGAISGI